MIGSVEGERCFNTLTFMKFKLHNKVINHMDFVGHTCFHKSFTSWSHLFTIQQSSNGRMTNCCMLAIQVDVET